MNTPTDKEILFTVLVYLVGSTNAKDDMLKDFLEMLKDMVDILPEHLQKLSFVQIILTGDLDNAKSILEEARNFLYSDLLSTIEE